MPDWWEGRGFYPATKEQCNLLLQKIKANGYKWNEETKNLEKLVEPKFKDGDIAVTNEGYIHLLRTKDSSYCAYRERWEGLPKFDKTITTGIEVERLASEEEKAKLFKAIKDNGYRWNAETKALEELIQPKFKVGDKIFNVLRKSMGALGTFQGTISEITDDKYIFTDGSYMFISSQDNYELVPDKFDITTLKPFDQVLVRDFDNTPWEIEFFSRLLDGKHFKCSGLSYMQCIPYKGNEHLNGKKDDCNKYFKTWE
jgi:hypothetical protein